MRASVVWAVVKVSFREHMRTPEALFWTYGFPVLMAIGLGLAFGEREPSPIEVVVIEGPHQIELERILDAQPRIEAHIETATEGDRQLVMGEADALVSGAPRSPTLRIDPSRDGAEQVRMIVDDAIQESAGRTDPVEVVVEREDREGSRYIDFLIPGLIGLNLLGSGLWGVGFQLVYMRTKNLLRRLLVAPMARGEFLLGFLLSRVVLMVPESLIIATFGWLAFGVPLRGTWLAMFVLLLLSAMAFAGLGVLLASRARSIEAVSGLMNLIILPMWLLGGSLFSNARFPDVMQPLLQALPLTQANDALRAMMLGGGGFAEIWPALAYFGGMSAVCLLLALRIFRWN